MTTETTEENEVSLEDILQGFQENLTKVLVLGQHADKTADDARGIIVDIVYGIQVELIRLNARIDKLEGETNA